MEVSDCTKIIHNRLQKLEPEHATKIIGYLLLKYTHQDIIEYATGDDKLIHALISEAKAYLRHSSKPNVPGPLPSDYPLQHLPLIPAISRSFSSPSSFRVPAAAMVSPYWDHHNADLIGGLSNQTELLNLDEHCQLSPSSPDLSSNFYYPDPQIGGGLGLRASLRSPPVFSDSTSKACHYHYYKGYCKHGGNCRFYHGQNPQTFADSFSQMYNPNLSELANDDHIFAPGSLEMLDLEISELLKERKGQAVSIASLPIMYLEKYGKALQAEGYLTESQRHGKAGFSLTKLLDQLKSIRLIDRCSCLKCRPHGQHSVVLAEDAPMYMDYRNERSDLGAVLASSHQIYLTFPAESTFTDADVLHYFEQYGPVRDVRIPRQEKRMFGFVSFMNSDSVRNILSKGHPHFICGSRVLVKPYREKTRMYDRKYTESLPSYYPLQFDMDPELAAVQRENSRLLKRRMFEEQQQLLELERRRVLEMQLTPKHLMPNTYLSYGMENLKLSDDQFNLGPSAQNPDSAIDDKQVQTRSNNADQDSSQIELPESPFASPRTSIYTVV